MNSENSKTSEPHICRLDLMNKINLDFLKKTLLKKKTASNLSSKNLKP